MEPTQSADKRSVSTDALETLGTFIGEGEKRDAIHLAVLPAVAGEDLEVSQAVALGDDGKAYKRPPCEGIGIVDPFLPHDLEAGQRFWLVVYPRKITSLRHVWTHPDIPDTEESKAVSDALKAVSERWLRNFIENTPGIPNDYEYVVSEAASCTNGFLIFYDGGNGSIPPEFWDHVETVTGKVIAQKDRTDHFSCTC